MFFTKPYKLYYQTVYFWTVGKIHTAGTVGSKGLKLHLLFIPALTVHALMFGMIQQLNDEDLQNLYYFMYLCILFHMPLCYFTTLCFIPLLWKCRTLQQRLFIFSNGDVARDCSHLPLLKCIFVLAPFQALLINSFEYSYLFLFFPQLLFLHFVKYSECG